VSLIANLPQFVKKEGRTVDLFDDPDITIFTNDNEASFIAWQIANAAEKEGDQYFSISEKLERSFTTEAVREVWIIVDDLLKTRKLLLEFYAAYKALSAVEGRRTTIRFGARVRVDRDHQERLRSLGIDLIFEKSDGDNRVKSKAERQWQLWVADNVHNAPGLSESEFLDAELARLRKQLDRDLPELTARIEEELGDIDDLLRAAYESIHDPELGFKDSND